jgi:hypothetical protein
MNIGLSRGFRHADDYLSKAKLGNTIGAAESKTSRTKKKKYSPLFYKVLVATVSDWPVYCRLLSRTSRVSRRPRLARRSLVADVRQRGPNVLEARPHQPYRGMIAEARVLRSGGFDRAGSVTASSPLIPEIGEDQGH